MKILNKEDIIDIVWGSAFFSGGGGGSISNAMMLLGELPPEQMTLKLCGLEEMDNDPDTLAVMIAALGSPLATEDETFSSESVAAVEAAIKEARLRGKNLKYLYSGEQGGANTMLALYVAMKLNMPLLDVDANGRAVPELYTTLAALYGVPTSPVILSSAQGDTITIRCASNQDAAMCEDIARDLCGVTPPGLGFTAWPMNRQQISQTLCVGQISRAHEIGHVIRNLNGEDVRTAIFRCFDRFDIYEYAEGKIVEITNHTEHGFDFGELRIQNNVGRTWRVKYQNENLLVMDENDQVTLTVPDIITVVEKETGRPLSNTETKLQQDIYVLGFKANAKWDTEIGYRCWKDSLHDAGYDGPRHPVQILD